MHTHVYIHTEHLHIYIRIHGTFYKRQIIRSSVSEAKSSDFLLSNTHVCLHKPHNFRPLHRYRNGGSDLRLISPILSNEITEIQQPPGSR